jgi:hypothetical protein
LKTEAALQKAKNKFIINAKKMEQKFMRGKIDFQELCIEVDELYDDYNDEIEHVWDTERGVRTSLKRDVGTYSCAKVSEYCWKLYNFQQKTVQKMQEEIASEERRLLKEALELDRQVTKDVHAKAKASAKKKLASMFASVNKKTVTKIVAAIGATATIGTFAAILKGKTSSANHNESYDEDIFDLDVFEESVENDIFEDSEEIFEESYEEDPFDNALDELLSF